MDLGNCALTEIPKELQQLTHLKSLNLGSYYWDSKEGEYRESSNSLSENMFPHVIDFSWEKLPNLHTLTLSNTKITDVSTVQHLSNLQKLDLSNTKVTDVSALQHLSNLQQLDLSYTKVTDVSALQHLSNLQHLTLSDICLDRFPRQLLFSPSMESIIWENGSLPVVPRETFSQSYDDSCLERLRDYYTTLEQHGSKTNLSVKLLLTGNGRVGKTSLVNRLLYNTFDESEKSTDGIIVKYWNDGVKVQNKPVQIQVWDFAGQDIYQATHRLFMRSKAIYLVMWDVESEKEPNHVYQEYTYQNYKLGYWLYHAQHLGQGSPIIVVQNKIEKDGRQSQLYLPHFQEHYPIANQAEISCKENEKNGFDLLIGIIQNVGEQMSELQEKWPKPYLKVKGEIEKLQQQGIKQLTYEDYYELCEGVGLDQVSASAPDSLLHLLHHSGTVFYQQDLFHNQLILDQQWAIDAVYTLFRRQDNTYRKLLEAKKGHFTIDDLEKPGRNSRLKNEHFSSPLWSPAVYAFALLTATLINPCT